jgi:zinc transport system ATP-binding protein
VSALPDSPPPIVTLDRVRVRLQGHTIVDDVSFSIERGGLHVIAGPNGAGKSTLFRALLGQLAFDGRIVLHWSGSGIIGYVPQSFAIDPTLPVTVLDFLALTRQRWPVSLGVRSATRRKIDGLLAQVGMQGRERRPVSGLSGGELRRVLLAHALDPMPELLLLDEPSSGLDELSARWLEELLSSLRRQRTTTVLMISHDHEQTRRLADRVTVLDGGVVADGLPEEVLGAAMNDTIVAGRRRELR